MMYTNASIRNRLRFPNGLMSINIMWIICCGLGRCQISKHKHLKETVLSIIIKTLNDWMSSQTLKFIPSGESRDNTSAEHSEGCFFLITSVELLLLIPSISALHPLCWVIPPSPPLPEGYCAFSLDALLQKGMVMLFHSQLRDYIQLQYILRNKCNSSRYVGAGVSCIHA